MAVCARLTNKNGKIAPATFSPCGSALNLNLPKCVFGRKSLVMVCLPSCAWSRKQGPLAFPFWFFIRFWVDTVSLKGFAHSNRVGHRCQHGRLLRARCSARQGCDGAPASECRDRVLQCSVAVRLSAVNSATFQASTSGSNLEGGSFEMRTASSSASSQRENEPQTYTPPPTSKASRASGQKFQKRMR